MTTIHAKNFVWMHFVHPVADDVFDVAKNYELHPLAVEELTRPTFRPKVEQYDSHLYLVLHFPIYNDKDSNHGAEIDFIVGKNFFITTQYTDMPAFEDFLRMCESDKRKAKQFMGSTGELLYHLLSHLFTHALRELEIMDSHIAAMKTFVFRVPNRKFVEDISLLRREVLDFRRTIQPQQSVLESLEQEGKMFFGKEMRLYLSRIIGDYLRVWHILENHKETIEALHETNETLISLRTAEITKNLTIMAFITFPLTLLASLFGMNAISVPIVGLPYDFWIIIGIMAASVIGMFAYFHHKKWL